MLDGALFGGLSRCHYDVVHAVNIGQRESCRGTVIDGIQKIQEHGAALGQVLDNCRLPVSDMTPSPIEF